jgi:hypothetical protein
MKSGHIYLTVPISHDTNIKIEISIQRTASKIVPLKQKCICQIELENFWDITLCSESQQMFQRNEWLPSSGSNKPSKILIRVKAGSKPSN